MDDDGWGGGGTTMIGTRPSRRYECMQIGCLLLEAQRMHKLAASAGKSAANDKQTSRTRRTELKNPDWLTCPHCVSSLQASAESSSRGAQLVSIHIPSTAWIKTKTKGSEHSQSTNNPDNDDSEITQQGSWIPSKCNGLMPDLPWTQGRGRGMWVRQGCTHKGGSRQPRRRWQWKTTRTQSRGRSWRRRRWNSWRRSRSDTERQKWKKVVSFNL